MSVAVPLGDGRYLVGPEAVPVAEGESAPLTDVAEVIFALAGGDQ